MVAIDYAILSRQTGAFHLLSFGPKCWQMLIIGLQLIAIMSWQIGAVTLQLSTAMYLLLATVS
jgi:hypothetical protein